MLGLGGALTGLALAISVAQAQTPAPVRFTGEVSCASSGCHGGASRNQSIVWSKLDFHTRAYATLTTGRAERMAEALGITRPSEHPRCTVCHAPFHGVPDSLFVSPVDPRRGVSCETCHGPAEPWIRSHTRPDYTQEQRIAAGLRELKSVYTRANTCVACHQAIDPEILRAAHPELLFELDGQCASQPRHWVETQKGPRLWLAGQAVAFREMTWQRMHASKPLEPRQLDAWNGLAWLLQQTFKSIGAAPEIRAFTTGGAESELRDAHRQSDLMARAAASIDWPVEKSLRALRLLSSSKIQEQILDRKIRTSEQARRAERLAVGLDRLLMALPDAARSGSIDADVRGLMDSVQSLSDFDPVGFAKRLSTLHARALEIALPPSSGKN